MKIDEMKIGIQPSDSSNLMYYQELDKGIDARQNAARKLLEGEQRLTVRREFYSQKKATIEAEQQEIDDWFVSKPRWKKGAALREEAQALDGKSASSPRNHLTCVVAEITRSPSELEQLRVSLQEVTQRVGRLTDACKRSEMEAKDLRAGVRRLSCLCLKFAESCSRSRSWRHAGARA